MGDPWNARATPWVLSNGLSGVEAASEEGVAVATCPQHAEVLVAVEEAHDLLNAEPVVGLRLHGRE
ncbi:MAG: hypothetical protein RXO32_01965 [Thermoproteus sp.]|jgi:hypothetical protein